jgi:hypothetical protein
MVCGVCDEPVFEGQDGDGQTWWPAWIHCNFKLDSHFVRDVRRG